MHGSVADHIFNIYVIEDTLNEAIVIERFKFLIRIFGFRKYRSICH